MRYRVITTLAVFLSFAAAGSAPAVNSVHIQFPKNFGWCVATAAHQVEGGNIHSDWWDWEQIPGNIKNGDSSLVADDHWNRVDQDIGLMKDIHMNRYRFSVEWAKIEPSDGVWDYAAMDHYVYEVRALAAAGIEPMVTLQHFTFPRWVAEKGGWEWDGLPDHFERFVRFVYQNIGQYVTDWVTVNEPTVTVTAGYLVGMYPPGKTQPTQGLLAPLVGIMKTHARAYHALHEEAAAISRPCRVGMAHHLRIYDPQSKWNPFDVYAANSMERLSDWTLVEALESGRFNINIPFFLKADVTIPGLAHTQDFVGLNYYSRDHVQFTFNSSNHIRLLVPRNAPTNDLGWEIYPEGFYRILKKIPLHVPGKPIIVTENGIADAKDRQRGKFIEDHLAQMARAINEGVPVEGYCHWSLYDNFEWDEGYSARFGLYNVNYSTQERTLRPSGAIYSQIAADNGFTYNP